MRRLGAVLLLVVGACSGSTPGSEGGAAATAATVVGGAASTGQPASGGRGDALTCWEASPAGGASAIEFSDQTAALGLVEPLTGMYAHAAAWGDVSGEGDADLVVGTFADRRGGDYAQRGATGPSPDRLLLAGSPFTPVEGLPADPGRTAAAVVVDLDGDGGREIVLSRNGGPGGSGGSSLVLHGVGESWEATELPLDPEFKGRSLGVIDVDGDGLLDLFVPEDRFFDGGSSVLLRNLGGLSFEVVSDSGIPDGVDGLGSVTADLNSDGLTDLFVAGSNRLFIAEGAGRFREAPSEALQWETFGDEDDVSGAAAADLNRDGLPDLLVGHHYNSATTQPVAVRLYLHRGLDAGGDPVFEDVTESAGLVPLPAKAPHVQLEDMDNDGWLDIITTASAADGTRPAVFRNLGLENGTPRFEAPAGLGSPQYWVTGPTADVDRDGRLDLLLVEWEPSLPSLLMRNETASGHWLEVTAPGLAAEGVGALVEVYEAGHLGDAGSLLGSREITVSEGYSSGHEPVAHFGLGDADRVDVLVRPAGGEEIRLDAVAADRRIGLPGGCG